MGTVYQSIYNQPDSYAIDMANNQVFSCKVQGSSIDAYQLVIKTLANVTKYDSTKVTLSPVLYNDDTLNITVTGGSVTEKGQLKYTIKTFSGTNSATTREITFYSATTPTATLTITSPVANKQVDLTTVYTQSQSVPVQSYQYFLYDDAGTTVLDQSDLIYSGKLQYSFDGLLDLTTYKARCLIINSYLQTADTGLIEFEVDYLQPNINIVPTAEVDEDLSAIKLGIGEVVQNIGSSTGTIAYIEDFLIVGNTGLQLNSVTDTAFWNMDIPVTFSSTHNWVANGFVSGKIIDFVDDSSNYLEIGYDGTNFYLDINGDVISGSVLALNSDVYVFGILNQKVVICQSNIIIDIIKPWWIE